MQYEWRNTETGEVIEHDHYRIPPDDSGRWVRVFAFGVGRVEGGGGSPNRPSVRPSGSGGKTDRG